MGASGGAGASGAHQLELGVIALVPGQADPVEAEDARARRLELSEVRDGARAARRPAESPARRKPVVRSGCHELSI